MILRKLVFLGFCLWLAPAVARGEEAAEIHIKAMALQPNGAVAMDLSAAEWHLKADGKDVPLTTVLPPAEVSKRPVKWAIVLMPVWDPDVRKVTLAATATFLKKLPATDSVLLVMQGKHGLECLTPGFTRRPSLWAAALDQAVAGFQASVRDITEPFTLPASPTQEPREDKQPIQAFLDRLEKLELKRQMADIRSRRNFKEDYIEQRNGIKRVEGARFERLRGWTKTATMALDALNALAQTLAKEPGEKQVVVFSRNEVDDLGSPLWQSGSSEIDVSTMSSTMRLALQSTLEQFAKTGLTLHLVSGAGLGYSGALGQTAMATGGYTFTYNPALPDQLTRVLDGWVNRYELAFPLPAGTKRPTKLEVGVSRKDFRLFAPSLY